MACPSLCTLRLDIDARSRSHHEHEEASRDGARRRIAPTPVPNRPSTAWDSTVLSYATALKNDVLRNELLNGGVVWAYAHQLVEGRRGNSLAREAFKESTVPPLSPSTKGGGSNDFITIKTYEKPSALTYFALTGHGAPPTEYGIRMPREVPRSRNTRVESVLDEVTMTLEAARLDIGPAVYGVVLVESDATYMLQTGVELADLIEATGENVVADLARWTAIGSDFLATMLRAASHGMLVTDIKYENIVVIGDASVRLIDFDGTYTTFVPDATEECVFVINAVLSLGQQLRASYPLPEHMRNCVYRLMRPCMAKLREVLPTVKAEASGLCNVLGQILGRKLTYSFLYKQRSVHGRPLEEVAERILERAERYARWLELNAFAAPNAPAHKMDEEASAFWQITSWLDDDTMNLYEKS